MRTFLRGKARLLFVAFAVVLAVPAIALADTLNADADGDALATPNGNGTAANQAPGTTVAYPFSAYIKETGNANDDVFPGTVNVSITRGGAWLATDATGAGSPSSFAFTGYNAAQNGTVRITVPSGTPVCTTKEVTVTLTAGQSTNGESLASANDTITLHYSITANGTPATDCSASTPANAAPTADAGGPYEFDEGSATNALSGSGTDAEDDAATPPVPLTYAWDLDDNGTFETSGQNPNFDATNIDGPATRTVTLRVTDSGGVSTTDQATVNIRNVAPDISSITPSPQNALTGGNITFSGAATDPSIADTNAGFFWQWSTDGTNYGPSLPNPFLVPNTYSNQYTTSFSSCGQKSVYAKATDKDLGTSVAETGSVNVYSAPFKAPLNDGALNTVQRGRVIPVKISVGCGTDLLTGLAPRIDLLSGNVSPENESGSTAVTTSVSSADTGQIMRPVDGGYIYNLQVPSTAGTYTIRVNPWGTQANAAAWAASSNYIVLDVRSK